MEEFKYQLDPKMLNGAQSPKEDRRCFHSGFFTNCKKDGHLNVKVK